MSKPTTINPISPDAGAVHISDVLAESWSLRESALASLGMAVSAAACTTGFVQLRSISGQSAASGDGAGKDALWTNDNGIAMIPIWGVLRRSDSQVQDNYYGRFGTSHEMIRRAMAQADADPSVFAKVFVIDSPGGVSSGMDGLAAHVRESNARKPIVAYVDGGAYSAAYWIAASTSKIVAERDRGVGSIGTYMVAYDYQKWLNDSGITAHLISSGGIKGQGAFGTPITDELRANLKRSVDALQSLFSEAVAKGRNIAPERVAAMATGEEWIGEAAKAAGLIDSVSGLSAVLAELRAAVSRAPVGVPSQRVENPMKSSSALFAPDAQAGGNGGGGDTGVVANLEKVRAEAAEAERTRISSINGLAEKFSEAAGVKDLAGSAVSSGMTVEAFRSKVLDVLASSKAPAAPGPAPTGPSVSVGRTQAAKMIAGLSLVLAAKADGSISRRMNDGGDQGNRMARAMGFESIAAMRSTYDESIGAGMASWRLLDIARACAIGGIAKIGQFGSFRSDDEMLASVPGHGAGDFPLLLSALANKVMQAAYSEAVTTWQEWAAEGNASDFKDNNLLRMSEMGNLQLLRDGDSPRYSSFNERQESVALATYARGFSLSRRQIYNDDLGAFVEIPRLWGVAAQRVPETLAYGVLTANAAMSDGVALFHGTHNNLPTGAALSMAALENAATVMRVQQGFGTDGTKANLFIEPKFLLVPTNLAGTATTLFEAEKDPTPAEANSSRPNTVRGLARPISSPILYRSSQTAWYLVGDPMQAPVVKVIFLNGQKTPIITQVGNGSILNTAWEIIFDCAAKSVNHEGAVKGN